jgi:hypothetical protein
MTEYAAPRPSFGRALGEVARKLGKLHRRALADFDSDFPSWMLLTLLAQQTSPIPVEDVVVELDRRMDLARPEVIGLLERTAAAGLVAYVPGEPAPTAALTDSGSAHYAGVYAHARKITDAACADIDPATLDAAVTVLLTVDARATRLLGS